MSGILQSLGAVLAIWAIIWYAWDHYANAVTYLLFFGLVSLLAGWVLQ